MAITDIIRLTENTKTFTITPSTNPVIPAFDISAFEPEIVSFTHSIMPAMFASPLLTGVRDISNEMLEIIMPIIYEVGYWMLLLSATQGLLTLMRKKPLEGMDKIKWAVIGYALLKVMLRIIAMIDQYTDAFSQMAVMFSC